MSSELDHALESTLGDLVEQLKTLHDVEARITALNLVRRAIAKVSPFSHEPVDCVEWVPGATVRANDYNPNAVAPPEMELLRVSITQDGYTQPIVTVAEEDRTHTVVDGFHRHRVGKECLEVTKRVLGYLPVVTIRSDREERADRIAATIRHNRARGKHQIEAMSDIVIELKRRNWSDNKISKELGMDQDEVLRLSQITGLAEFFSNAHFSQAWDVGIFDGEDTLALLSSEEQQEGLPDNDRILHTWEKWECYPAGFYETKPPKGYTEQQCEELYRDLLSDEAAFRNALFRVIDEWRYSCEHYLTNERMNRIAWLGQAALAITHGIPARFRGGYNLLTKAQQQRADVLALQALNEWRSRRGLPMLTQEAALSRTQPELY